MDAVKISPFQKKYNPILKLLENQSFSPKVETRW